MSYNAEIQGNNADLQTILDKVNALPDAGGGGDMSPQWQDITTLPPAIISGYTRYEIEFGEDVKAVLVKSSDNSVFDYVIFGESGETISNGLWSISGSMVDVTYETSEIEGKTVEYIVV